ncbi:MAG TPA: VOC family protein [Pyrinomonadaceae bacterium]|jgi:predicted enzyme related to lactoylglutathione lyase|nr:VOC family protein [Pyrinomonadaceae bacterium]
MSEQTMPAHGSFCWSELASTNVEAAKKFYSQLLGWELKEGEVAPMIYTEIMAGGKPVGGMYQMTPEDGDRPSHWMAYVAVDDVEASAKRVEELGGKICVPPSDIPNVGRFCVITDPSGASLSLVTLTGHLNQPH